MRPCIAVSSTCRWMSALDIALVGKTLCSSSYQPNLNLR